MNLHNQKLSPKILAALLLVICFSSCKKNLDQSVNATSQGASSRDMSRQSTQPNIILITADDVGYEIPTYSGGQSYSTPNLDFMAANGMQFPRFRPHPDGPPSRLALQTGKYNYRNWEKFGYLPPASSTIANMLHDANYATCFVGKWQFDGGDASIKSHGYDQYIAFVPFNPQDNNGHDQTYRRYKDPYLYSNGQYLPEDSVHDKYSEDIYADYMDKFIDSNLTRPFFLTYCTNLVQRPFSPTPDDSDYANWVASRDDATKANKKYYPGMVAYMDKMIGKLITKIQESGLANNTIIIFTSDNATNNFITSQWNGQSITGGKSSTTAKDMKVPMVVYGPGTVMPGVVDTSLADMTDLMPTIADMASIPLPTTWGPLDGTTFYDNLTGAIDTAKQRKTIYCYWPLTYANHTDISFVYDYKYKLYDSLSGGQFYNISKDSAELKPIKPNKLTPAEKVIRNNFIQIIRSAFRQKAQQ